MTTFKNMQTRATFADLSPAWFRGMCGQCRDLAANDNMNQLMRRQAARDLEAWAASRKEWTKEAMMAATTAQELRNAK